MSRARGVDPIVFGPEPSRGRTEPKPAGRQPGTTLGRAVATGTPPARALPPALPGLGRRQSAILRELADHPQGLTTTELGRDISPTSARHVLASLRRRGLAIDLGRPTVWLITEAGRNEIP